MREFLIENMDVIVAFWTMVITWLFGYLAKKSSFFSNNLIPLQNIIIMIIVVSIYWYLTGDFNMVIASSSPVATIIYDTIHCIRYKNCNN